MESHTQEQSHHKRPLLSGFDKIILFVIALILLSLLSKKMGWSMTQVEEKIEWVD